VTSVGRDINSALETSRRVLQSEQRGDHAAAALLFRTEGASAFDRANQSLLSAMEFDVKESERLARDVQAVRRSGTTNIIVLDILASIVAALAAVIALRAAREHDRLLQQHSALLSERVAELDRFAGRVSHDILSPLNVVSIGLKLLDRHADAALGTTVERCERALQRVKDLVTGLLQYARSSARVETGARAPFDLALQNIAADLTDDAKAHGIELIVEPSPAGEVACSVGVLASLVQNLVSNAIKYMGERPIRKITLRAKVAGGMARVEVEDTGPGIPLELQKEMFEPFVRGAHEHVGGMGLGLATVKRLVQGHGGAVGVQSSPGSGSLFWIALPVASDYRPGAGGASAPNAGQSASPR
jgi:signal transduction histidine kinase